MNVQRHLPTPAASALNCTCKPKHFKRGVQQARTFQAQAHASISARSVGLRAHGHFGCGGHTSSGLSPFAVAS